MMRDGFVPDNSDDPGVHAVAAAALELITDGARIGLGSGRSGRRPTMLSSSSHAPGRRPAGVAAQ
jgi:hypothetical protein